MAQALLGLVAARQGELETAEARLEDSTCGLVELSAPEAAAVERMLSELRIGLGKGIDVTVEGGVVVGAEIDAIIEGRSLVEAEIDVIAEGDIVAWGDEIDVVLEAEEAQADDFGDWYG